MTDPEQIMIEYGKRKARRGWLAGATVAGLIAMAAFIDSRGEWLVALLGLGALLVAIIYDFVSWRCPACNSALGRDWDYTFCPHCSARLHL